MSPAIFQHTSTSCPHDGDLATAGAPFSFPSSSASTSSHQHSEPQVVFVPQVSDSGARLVSGRAYQQEEHASLLGMPNTADISGKQYHLLMSGGNAAVKRMDTAVNSTAGQQQPAADDAMLEPVDNITDDDLMPVGDEDGDSSLQGNADVDNASDAKCSLGTDDEDDMVPSTSLKSHPRFMSSTDVADYDSEYGSDEGELEPADMVYCRNCTNPMVGDICASCHHCRSSDDFLLGFGVHGTSTPDLTEGGLVSSMSGAGAALLTAGPGGNLHMGPGPKSRSPPVALLFDDRMEMHEEGRAAPHPERPDRTRAIMAALTRSGLTDNCVRVDCAPATYDQLAAVHSADLIDFVKAMSEGLPPPPTYPPALLTSDTYINAHTYQCARLAAGGAAAVATMVAQGKAGHGAAIVRPPGHHAESNMAMGFCFFNNAAVAARAAQAAGAHRVLILDWDIHHGNGTQHIFQEDNSVLYMSLHRYDSGQFYPGSGACEEVGDGNGAGYTVNVAWEGSERQNGDYMAAFQHVLLPIAYQFNPHLIIVSAGFDAAEGDPIGGCRLTPHCFAHMTAMLKAVAPLVLLLEGGYNLEATAKSTEACLRVLLGEQPPVLPGPREPTKSGNISILRTMHAQAPYWGCMRMLWDTLRASLAPASAPAAGAVIVPPGQPPQPPRNPSIAAPTQAGLPPLVIAASKHSMRADGERKLTAALEQRKLRRKQQLFQRIRQQAMRAFWARHRRLVHAKKAAASMAAADVQP